MATIETIKQALSILKSHDFYYMMVDFGYEEAEKRAKESMKLFVKVTNTLPGEMRQLMRDLWTSAYEYFACERPFWTSPDINEKKAAYVSLMNRVNSMIAA